MTDTPPEALPLGAPTLAATAADSLGSPLGAPAIVPIGRLESLDPLKRSFRNFMFKTWTTLFGEPPTRRMYEVGERLQYGPAKDIVMGWRGLSKSYITVDFGVWALYVDPTEIVLTVSGSGDGAKGNATLAYAMINNFDWLAHMKPRGMLRQSAQAFDVVGSRMEKSESFAAMSLFGQLTGRRVSLAIPDDVETPNTSETEGDRSDLRLRYAEIGGSLLKKGGRIKVLGTPQTEQTLYTELATDKGYGMRIWPVVYPLLSDDQKRDEVHRYGPWLAPTILAEITANPELAGTSVEPTRFDEADLFGPQGRLIEYGAVEFDRQFRLFFDAGLKDDKPLKMRDIPVVEIAVPTPGNPLRVPVTLTWSPSPANLLVDLKVDGLNGDCAAYAPTGVDHWQEPELKTLVVDPSGKGDDETAWGVIAQHVGRVFLCHIGARRDGFSKDTMEAIAKDAKLYGVHKILIEKNFGDGMFGELLRPYLMDVAHPCTIEEESAGQVQKEIRIIDRLSGIITSHRLVIAADVLRDDWKVTHQGVAEAKRRFYRLTYQITRISKKKGAVAHDDRVDMLASGVASFIGTLRRQLEEATRENREAYLRDQADKIIETRRKQGQPLFGLEAGPSRLGNFVKAVGGMVNSPFFVGRQSAARSHSSGYPR